MLRAPEAEARSLALALIELKEKTTLCSSCQNVTEQDPCGICTDGMRDQATICVVEEPLDILAIERTRGFRGLYHVLHGVLSPMEGVGPDDLKINQLVARLRNGSVKARPSITVERTGATSMIFRLHWPGLPHEAVMRGLRLLGEKVRPLVR
jgi:recombination protein RecR